jgi:hypothetical protein
MLSATNFLGLNFSGELFLSFRGGLEPSIIDPRAKTLEQGIAISVEFCKAIPKHL